MASGASGAGLARVVKGLDDIDAAAIKAAKDLAALEKYAASIGAVTNAVNNTISSLKELDQVSGDVTVGFGAMLDITKALADYGRRGDATSTAAAQQAFAKQLQSLEDTLKTQLGSDNRFAADIDNVVQQLNAGLLSPEQALQVVKALIGPFSTTLMQEAIDPTESPSQRALAQELLNFLQSGQLPPAS